MEWIRLSSRFFKYFNEHESEITYDLEVYEIYVSSIRRFDNEILIKASSNLDKIEVIEIFKWLGINILNFIPSQKDK